MTVNDRVCHILFYFITGQLYLHYILQCGLIVKLGMFWH